MSGMADIFDYWRNKCITEDGEVMIEYGYDGCDEDALSKIDSVPVINDWGEPECFACRKYLYNYEPYPEKYEEYLNDSTLDGLKHIWNHQHTFQRAHIIPKAMGGSNKAENLFCLCPECHRESPDTRFSREFFRWVYCKRKGSYGDTIIDKAIVECKKRDIDPAFIKMGDLNLDNLNTHGGAIVESTKIAVLVACAELRQQYFIQKIEKIAICNLKEAHKLIDELYEEIKKPIDKNSILYINKTK